MKSSECAITRSCPSKWNPCVVLDAHAFRECRIVELRYGNRMHDFMEKLETTRFWLPVCGEFLYMPFVYGRS